MRPGSPQNLPRFTLAPDHPTVGEPCAACKVPFVPYDVTTLVELGPGNDPEQRRKFLEGAAYTAVCAHVHWACATGQEF